MGKEQPEDTPPQIPPRMKKKGPALPEKPPHMRASSQPREPLRPRVLNLEKPPGEQREVLVAACSRAGRPVERRQREPAKLLKPTGGSSTKDDLKKELSVLPARGHHLRLEDCLPPKRDFLHHSNHLWPPDDHASTRSSRKGLGSRAHQQQQQPVLLIPRNLLTAWGSSPVQYALWTQRDAPGIKSLRQNPLRTSDSASTVRARSGSVARSGSLTSQGSSGSDSGGETFPKSVLKKQRRSNLGGSTSKGSSSAGRKVDQKKNVTFNAFATVQLMEE